MESAVARVSAVSENEIVELRDQGDILFEDEAGVQDLVGDRSLAGPDVLEGLLVGYALYALFS